MLINSKGSVKTEGPPGIRKEGLKRCNLHACKSEGINQKTMCISSRLLIFQQRMLEEAPLFDPISKLGD